MRRLYALGLAYLSTALWLTGAPAEPAEAPPRSAPAAMMQAAPSKGPEAWFQEQKPFCNALEVAVRMKVNPPPAGAEGTGYAAACYALAGKIDMARQSIEALPKGQRRTAAEIVFHVGHPVADAGDDRSAGPIMELVIQFTPWNFMAVYHAGMSEYALGQKSEARRNLQRFLEMYPSDDGWRRNALQVLEALEQSP